MTQELEWTLGTHHFTAIELYAGHQQKKKFQQQKKESKGSERKAPAQALGEPIESQTKDEASPELEQSEVTERQATGTEMRPRRRGNRTVIGLTTGKLELSCLLQEEARARRKNARKQRAAQTGSPINLYYLYFEIAEQKTQKKLEINCRTPTKKRRHSRPILAKILILGAICLKYSQVTYIKYVMNLYICMEVYHAFEGSNERLQLYFGTAYGATS